MGATVVIMAFLLPVLVGVAYRMGTRRRADSEVELSPVTRQHLELLDGGELNERAVESAKERFRDLLERGDVEAVETSLRPGTQFAVSVRALAEIGTDEAGRILERQLHQRLSEDQLEQSWYWIDLACSLRSLNRSESLPQLVRCWESARELPLSHVLAAETACFPEFIGLIDQPQTALGNTALSILLKTLMGLRQGIPPQLIIEARLGELIEHLWDHNRMVVNPLIIQVFRESLRLLSRAPHAEMALANDLSEQEAFTWQLSRLAALEPALTDYLDEMPAEILLQIEKSPPAGREAWLKTLAVLRAKAVDPLLTYLDNGIHPWLPAVFEALMWSKNPQAGPVVCRWLKAKLKKKSTWGGMSWFIRRAKGDFEKCLCSALECLRRHGSPEVEKLLIYSSGLREPLAEAAIQSLGWWEPFYRESVLEVLQTAIRGHRLSLRRAARAAMARLGERQALQGYRQNLASEDFTRVIETIHTAANEGLFWLWPEIDALADSETTEVAFHAREALENLQENLDLKA